MNPALNGSSTIRRFEGSVAIEIRDEIIRFLHGTATYYITRECSALWGEPERVTEVCCRLSSTVENVALSLIFRRTRSFAWCRDSVIGERFEVYCELRR